MLLPLTLFCFFELIIPFVIFETFFLLVFLPTRAERLVKSIGDVSIFMQKTYSAAEKRLVEQVTILFTPKSFRAEFSLKNRLCTDRLKLQESVCLWRKHSAVFDTPISLVSWDWTGCDCCLLFFATSLASDVCRLRISVRRQTHLYEHSSKDVLGWFHTIKNKCINLHRSCGSDKLKELRLFQSVFLSLFIFGCFVCIGEYTTIGLFRLMDLLLSWSIYTKYVRFTGLVTFEIAIFYQNKT